METHVQRSNSDDPRRLREMMTRAGSLAREHGLRSVLVGLSGFEGDPSFPEIVDFIESALRVDDSVFRMTRERAVLLLTDVGRERAMEIVSRLLEEFREHFPSASPPAVGVGTFEVEPRAAEHSLKAVLPVLFAEPPMPH